MNENNGQDYTGRTPPPGEPPKAPEQPREYWSNLDARRAQGGYNPNGYRPPNNGGYQRPYQQPYQYGANSGWQPPQRPNEKYEWNFADYDHLGPQKKPKKKSGLVVFSVCLLCVLTVALVTMSGYSIWSSMVDSPEAPGQEAAASSALPQEPSSDLPQADGEAGISQMQIIGKPQVSDSLPAEGEKLTIPQVAKLVSPSVVAVIHYRNSKFYEPYGGGSGIIMSEDGYIITNAHVIAGADALKVILDNGDPYEATVIGSDTQTDLAVIKIEASGLTVAQFGDSNELEVGETVIAIGSPGGTELAGSVTQGIVSAVNRLIQTTGYSMHYIQTDAAINPGNSGGALVNEYGQVIGINSSKIVAEGYEGIGFAIPITEAKPIIDDLLQNGRVTGRVLLGISAEAIDEVTARTYDVPMGVQIINIDPQADIANRGVLKGDIITHIDGERIYNLDDIRTVLNRHKAGDIVRLTLYRQINLSQHTTLDVDVALMEDLG